MSILSSKKVLSKKTIVKVRGGEGQWSMVKDHTFALFNLGTLPLDCAIFGLILSQAATLGVRVHGKNSKGEKNL